MSGGLLCLGRQGQVATALVRRAAERGHAMATAGRPEFDMAVPGAARTLIEGTRPAAVLNAAAYTQVDKAETDEAAALALNATGPGEAAAAACAVGARFLHLSTDYVFPGDKPTAYTEHDPVGPTSAYGRSKLAGEQAVMAAHPQAFVLRTAWVYSSGGANFVRTMLRLATTRDEVGVVGDQFGCPTFADDIAEVMLTLSERSGPGGLYHLAGTGEASWAEFATAIFQGSAARGGPSAKVRAITTAEYPTPARRPANSRLSCEKLAADHGLVLPHWRDSLERCLDQIAQTGWRIS